MSASTSAAVTRFVAHAQAVLATPSRYTPAAVSISQELMDAVNAGDSFAAKSAVLEIDRLSRAKSWSK